MHVVHEHGESKRNLMKDTETSSASDCKRSQESKERCVAQDFVPQPRRIQIYAVKYAVRPMHNSKLSFSFLPFFCLLSLEQRERSESRSNSVIVCEE